VTTARKLLRLLPIACVAIGAALVAFILLRGDSPPVGGSGRGAESLPDATTAAGAGAESAARGTGPVDDVERTTYDGQPVRTEQSPRLAAFVTCDVEGNPIAGAAISLIPDREVAIPDWSQLDPGPFVASIAAHQLTTDAGGLASAPLASGTFLAVVRCAGRSPTFRWIELPLDDDLRCVLSDCLGLRGCVVDGATKQPISGAQVVAFPRSRADRREPGFRTLLDRVVVGQRAFTDAKGEFRLGEIALERLEVHVGASGYPSIEVVADPDGQRLVLELQGDAAANGIVTDRDGAPIEGAKVECYLYGKRPPPRVARVFTDRAGEFTMAGLPSGEVTFGVLKEGFALEKQWRTLAVGDAPYLEFSLSPEAKLHGIVVDPKGAPIRAAHVRVFDRTFNAEIGYIDSSDDGTWYMLWVPPGHRIDLSIDREGFLFADLDSVPLGEAPIRTVLTPLVTARGRVVDQDGRPVRSFEILVLSSRLDDDSELVNSIDPAWRRFESTDGSFAIPGIWPVPCEIEVAAPGFLAERRAFDGAALADGSELEIVLSGGAVISGRVVDAFTAPVPGAGVRIARVNARGREMADSPSVGATSDAGGAFSLRGAPSGRFDLEIRADGRGTTLLRDLTVDDFPRDLVLSDPGFVHGRVKVHWRDPASCVEVHLLHADTWLGGYCEVDPTGAFRSGPLGPGEYEIELLDLWARDEADAQFRLSKLVTVEPGRTTEVEFDATEGGVVEGRVVAGDAPIDLLAARVSIAPHDAPTRRFAVSRVASDSRFALRGIPPGRHDVALDLDRPGILLHSTQVVDVIAGRATPEVVFEIDAGLVDGVVREARGNGLRASVALVDPADGRIRGEVRTADDGRFRLAPREPGRRLLWVRANGFAEDGSRHLEDAPRDGSGAVIVTLDVEARLEVQVVDERGRGVEGAAVEVGVRGRPAILPRFLRASDPGGGARFGSLAQGVCTVAVAKRGHHAPPPVSAVVERGTTRRVVVELVRLATLQVRVRGERDAPVGEAPVAVIPTSSDAGLPPAMEKRTNDDGVARFEGLIPGRAVVQVGDVREEIDLPPGVTTTLEISSLRPGTDRN